MAYEKKVLDVLDKLVDSIIYEEGRLAIINKYNGGPVGIEAIASSIGEEQWQTFH